MFLILMNLIFWIASGIVLSIISWHIWLKLTVGTFNSEETMRNKVVLITGGNSGIGLETCLDLARRGAKLIIASRHNTLKIQDQIFSQTGNDQIIFHELDLSSRDSVRKFAKQILQTESRIDVMIHNSGCASTSKTRQSVDGIELTMATNHFGPFLLTHLLIDLLKKSKCPRIVIVSSAYYRIARVNLENLNPIGTFPMYLYYVTKTANIMFGLELAKRLKSQKISVFMVNPGMCNTAIFKKVPFPLNLLVRFSFKTPKQGAQTTIMCAVSKDLEDSTGEYFSDCKKQELMSFVKNEKNNHRFWMESMKIVQLSENDPKI